MKSISSILILFSLVIGLSMSSCGGSESGGEGGDQGNQSENNNSGNTGNNQPAENFTPAPDQLGPIQFSHPDQSFGTVKSGAVIKKAYKFKNMKNYSVYIDSVYTACECLHAEYPHRAIAPGEIATLTGVFDTKAKQGKFERIFSVMVSNEQIPVTLYLKGEVIP